MQRKTLVMIAVIRTICSLYNQDATSDKCGK